MKIAVTGKGGVGKTTLSALLCYVFSSEGKKVIAVDADPDANLAVALGVSEEDMRGIRPIADMTDLIEERTGVRPGTSGGVFKLNPRVDDIPEHFGYRINNITLLIMGKSKTAASGCYCPESSLLKRLLKHLVLERDEVIIVDMEAGIEHLTRGTTAGVDAFIVVVEPGQRSIETARSIRRLSKELGVKSIFIVANKIRKESDIVFVREKLHDMSVIGYMHYHDDIMESDISGMPCFQVSEQAVEEAISIKKYLEKTV